MGITICVWRVQCTSRTQRTQAAAEGNTNFMCGQVRRVLVVVGGEVAVAAAAIVVVVVVEEEEEEEEEEVMGW